MSRFCPQCGNPVEAGKPFCSTCGNRLEGSGAEGGYAPPPPPQPYAPQPQYNPRPKKRTALLLILAGVFVALAGTALALIFILGPYDAKPKELNGEWELVLKLERVLNADAGYANEDEIGDERDSSMVLDLNKNGEGEAMISGLRFDAAYSGGKIVAESMLDENLQVSLNGTLRKEKEDLVFSGTWQYTLLKGKDKGVVAQGSWRAVLANTEDEDDSKSPAGAQADPTVGSVSEPETASSGADISAAELEGTWKGMLKMDAMPGLDGNPNIADEDKAYMKEEIGQEYELVIVIRNGKLWLGDESDAEYMTDDDMGVINFNGTWFSGTIESDMGTAELTGELVTGGKPMIQCKIVFPSVRAYNSDTETVTIEASFNGEKQ
jgi:hypothetical protein